MNPNPNISNIVELLLSARTRLKAIRHDKKASSQFLIEWMDDCSERVIRELEGMDAAQRQVLIQTISDETQMKISGNLDLMVKTFKKTPKFARKVLIQNNIQRILGYLRV